MDFWENNKKFMKPESIGILILFFCLFIIGTISLLLDSVLSSRKNNSKSFIKIKDNKKYISNNVSTVNIIQSFEDLDDIEYSVDYDSTN